MPLRCDECKHWGKEPAEWEAIETNMHQCDAVRTRWDIQDEAVENMPHDARWTRNDLSDEYKKRRRDALVKARAFVQDGSEYRAELFTRAEFFCALFEPKT